MVTLSLLIVGVIHFLPVSGVLGAERLAGLYGVDVSDPSLSLLMRHRAVLFGLLGAFLVYAAFVPSLHWLGLGAGLVSVGGFLALAWQGGGAYSEQLRTVVIVDLVALLALILATVARFGMSRTS
ncbi:MAG: phosphopantetheine adenylyltransferase [Pseudomonadota bacterium]